MLGRALLDFDEVPGAPSVVVLGYDVWQRSFGGRHDVVGSVLRLGNTPATVIGVMPDGFGYPANHDAWAPLQLRASYGALQGGPISVIGRLELRRDQWFETGRREPRLRRWRPGNPAWRIEAGGSVDVG